MSDLDPARRVKRDRRFRAIVLHVRNFGEAHRVVELMTAEEGRVVAVARNARTSQRRFSGALDVFASIEAELTIATGLWRLEQATLVQPRLSLRADLVCFGRACRCLEALKLLVAEHQASPQAYAALADALDYLDQGDVTHAATFYPRLLTAAGIAPDLQRCVGCGAVTPQVTELCSHRGGALCVHCSPYKPVWPPAVLAALAGGECNHADFADAVEAHALAWVEAQTGRVVRTRRMRLTQT